MVGAAAGVVDRSSGGGGLGEDGVGMVGCGCGQGGCGGSARQKLVLGGFRKGWED